MTISSGLLTGWLVGKRRMVRSAAAISANLTAPIDWGRQGEGLVWTRRSRWQLAVFGILNPAFSSRSNTLGTYLSKPTFTALKGSLMTKHASFSNRQSS